MYIVQGLCPRTMSRTMCIGYVHQKKIKKKKIYHQKKNVVKKLCTWTVYLTMYMDYVLDYVHGLCA
jgi:hypothetical protein